MLETFRVKELAQNLGCTVRENEPMCRHTSFQIGGPARLFIETDREDHLARVLRECTKHGVPFLILGKGSNLLISDAGLNGAVLHLKESAPPSLQGDSVVCGAGVPLGHLCQFALQNSLTGLEFAWGIPGSAGGAAFMNAGAYGGEMKDVLTGCDHLTPDGEAGFLSAREMDLSYRHSAYAQNRCLITALHLRLSFANGDAVRARMDELYARRLEKQPLEYPSAGSIFKRPPGNYAGTLIESCGLKGKSIGGAQVSAKHAGFIINTGGACCDDVKRLIELIQNEVLRQTGILLECEIKVMEF